MDPQAEEAAFSQQYDAQQAAAKQAELDKQTPPSFLQKWVTGPLGRVSTSMIDGAVSAADSMYDSPEMRKARDVAAGGITGAVNIADTAKSAVEGMADATDPYQQKDPVAPSSPIWDHARSSILDFRDAVTVQDPTLADHLVQGVSQLAIPFAGYSRALAGLHGLANMYTAGALTDATALGPHDARVADLIALGRHTEGKLGDALRALSPDGSAMNAYINYLGDRTDEGEAEGRFKNVLDGFGTGLITTPLMQSAASILKQGSSALRYAAENFGGGPIAGGMKAQRGSVGARPQVTPGDPFYYHATTKKFDAFQDGNYQSGDLVGHYFSDSEEGAKKWSSYAQKGSDDPVRIVASRLDLQKPASYQDVKTTQQELGPKWTARQLTAALKEKGFDGYKDENEAVVFGAKQIRGEK